MEKLYIIKIGGNIIDEESALSGFLSAFAELNGKKILVHGGGKLATRLAEKLGISQQLVDGRRITDSETLDIVTMVYAGLVNKKIVAGLQAKSCNAIGLTGADANIILAHKRTHAALDYGFVGDIDAINDEILKELLDKGLSPILAPITHNGDGQLLNTNADSIAQETARSLGKWYEVSLVYSFEKSGVLLDASDDATVIPSLNPTAYQKLKEEKKIFAGMIPKLDNAFKALDSGVKQVIIGKAEKLAELVNHRIGTKITNE